MISIPSLKKPQNCEISEQFARTLYMNLDIGDFFVVNTPFSNNLDNFSDDLESNSLRNPYQGLVFKVLDLSPPNVAAKVLNLEKGLNLEPFPVLSLDLRGFEINTVSKSYAHSIAPSFFEQHKKQIKLPPKIELNDNERNKFSTKSD